MTPRGSFRLLGAMIRADRIGLRSSDIELTQILPSDGWCDAPGDRNYNRPVSLPYPASHEELSRQDHLYDVAIVMDYNVTQRLTAKGGGSAIFFHLAREGYTPTEGCVAVSRRDMLWLLPRLGPETEMVIG